MVNYIYSTAFDRAVHHNRKKLQSAAKPIFLYGGLTSLCSYPIIRKIPHCTFIFMTIWDSGLAAINVNDRVFPSGAINIVLS